MQASAEMTKSRKRSFRRSLALGATALALSGGAAGAVAGTASAADLVTGHASSNAGMCPISVDVRADKVHNGWFADGRLHTQVDIGPNGYVFLACRYKVGVDVLAYGQVARHFEYTATAGAALDPWGNHKWPSFDETFDGRFMDMNPDLRITLSPITT